LNPHASKELQVKSSCIIQLKPSKNETPMHQVIAPHINKTRQNINLNFQKSNVKFQNINKTKKKIFNLLPPCNNKTHNNKEKLKLNP